MKCLAQWFNNLDIITITPGLEVASRFLSYLLILSGMVQKRWAKNSEEVSGESVLCLILPQEQGWG